MRAVWFSATESCVSMTDMAYAEKLAHGEIRMKPAAVEKRRPASVVPPHNVAGTALAIVIGIMTFLSCLTLGAVSLVRDTASQWETQIAREATIQIKPVEGLDMEAALKRASELASTHRGVTSTRIVDRAATVRLLQPWLGESLDIDRLPVPRLIIVTVDKSNLPDFAALRADITREIPTGSVDDHRTWVDRLVGMARSTVAIGVAVLALILSATVLTVVFATRGAMSGNGGIIEVLHFVGAEARYIAKEFRIHFLKTGLRGATVGGLLAAGVFLGFSWWSQRNLATPQGDQASALFGNFAIGLNGYLGVALIVLLVAGLTAATTHVTVLSHLGDLDQQNGK